MDERPYTHFIAVGACYIDTILTLHTSTTKYSHSQIPSHRIPVSRSSVPAYPPEDAKQRASAIAKRRGGNCPNALEVLQQLLALPPPPSINNKTNKPRNKASQHDISQPKLILLCPMPAPESADTKFIIDSFNSHSSPISSTSTSEQSTDMSRVPVNLKYTFARPTPAAAASYIIQSSSTHTRTIVNYNGLEEMTLAEFQDAMTSIPDLNLDSPSPSPTTAKTSHNPRAPSNPNSRIWVHFEGRIPPTTASSITWLRTHLSPADLTISVECEKPARPGLDDLAGLADVVFYSRSWAEGRRYDDARSCLIGEARRIIAQTEVKTENWKRERLVLACTWGEHGAGILDLDTAGTLKLDESSLWDLIAFRPAWEPPPPGSLEVVDTIGAGDTWIAGMVFTMICTEWDCARRVEFANELAGRKIARDGFDGLGREMRSWLNWSR